MINYINLLVILIVVYQLIQNSYKYSKLTEKEYLRKQRQTEEGIPNEFNRFLRQDLTGESIEDIKTLDNAYNESLS